MATSKSKLAFQQIATQYDGFIFDQWGVLHNGVEVLGGASETLIELAKAKKKLVILSNSSKPAASTYARLETKFGFNKESFVGALTSGHRTHLACRNRFNGNKCVMLAQSIDDHTTEAWLDGTNVTLASWEEADFVLCLATMTIRDGNDIVTTNCQFSGDVDLYRDGLKIAAGRKLPMLCANSDFVSVAPGGRMNHCAGTLAKLYESLGGSVEYFGKPLAEPYLECVEMLGLHKSRVCHVGDSLHHDIAGANAAGVDSIFIVNTGVHAAEVEDMSAANDTQSLEQTLQTLFVKYTAVPTHVLPSVAW
eukprot:m.114064 g.114064  ORF g.114064 m.114064 type:complete len:307 (+) comp28325_c0_seq1:135-1055(+)